jgi:hypothetical protein
VAKHPWRCKWELAIQKKRIALRTIGGMKQCQILDSVCDNQVRTDLSRSFSAYEQNLLRHIMQMKHDFVLPEIVAVPGYDGNWVYHHQ